MGLVKVKFNTTMAIEAALNQTTLLPAENHRLLQRNQESEEGVTIGRRVADFTNFTLINNGTIYLEE